MGPLEAIKTGFAKSFDFKGRASRSEFWWFAPVYTCFVCLIPVFEPNWLTPVLLQHFSTATFLLLFWVIALLPVFALLARRFRDIGLPTALLAVFPIYLMAAPFIVGLIDQSETFGMPSPGRYLPEAFYAILGYFALLTLAFVAAAKPTFSDHNPNEVPS